jgi:L-alanine-DL-glutamate epimerase-like enolase superfamily enzyme
MERQEAVMKLTNIEVSEFEPPFRGTGYRMSFVHQTKLHNRLVRITTSDGRVGIGEIARSPKVDPAAAAALEDEIFPDLVGSEFEELPRQVEVWRQSGLKLFGLAFGMETAFFDLLAQAAGVPLSLLLGGSLGDDMPEYLSISSEAPEEMRRTIEIRGGAHPVIQAKLGIDDLDTDMRRVEAVLAAMRPDQLLLADFNEALTPADARTALPAITDPRLVWEEPCKGYDSNLEIASVLEAPVMFDQCMSDVQSFLRATNDRAATYLVVKPALMGGLTVARQARDICSAANMKMRIDGPWCGQIGGAAVLHLAIGAPSSLLIASLDTTEPVDTDHSLIDTRVPGRVAPISGIGLGTLPDGRQLFPAPLARYGE